LSGAVACGRDAIMQVPGARWDVHAIALLPEPVASRVRHGGFVCGAELADSAAFGVSAAEAAAMDPCQRLLLERGYTALHDGAWGRAALGGSLTGIFLGFAGSEFGQLLAASPAGGSVYAATGSASSIASGRLSYVLGLHGPCASYDTACSAALVACHGGLRALQLGECAAGLVAVCTPQQARRFRLRRGGSRTRSGCTVRVPRMTQRARQRSPRPTQRCARCSWPSVP